MQKQIILAGFVILAAPLVAVTTESTRGATNPATGGVFVVPIEGGPWSCVENDGLPHADGMIAAIECTRILPEIKQGWGLTCEHMAPGGRTTAYLQTKGKIRVMICSWSSD
jgi:hypothetical protein